MKLKKTLLIAGLIGICLPIYGCKADKTDLDKQITQMKEIKSFDEINYEINKTIRFTDIATEYNELTTTLKVTGNNIYFSSKLNDSKVIEAWLGTSDEQYYIYYSDHKVKNYELISQDEYTTLANQLKTTFIDIETLHTQIPVKIEQNLLACGAEVSTCEITKSAFKKEVTLTVNPVEETDPETFEITLKNGKLVSMNDTGIISGTYTSTSYSASYDVKAIKLPDISTYTLTENLSENIITLLS